MQRGDWSEVKGIEMTWLFKIFAVLLMALALPSCAGPADSQVEADARAIVKQHLGNAADVLWLVHSVVEGGNSSLEWDVVLKLIGKSSQRVSAGAFQGLDLSVGATVPVTKLHLFYRHREDLKAWELYAFSVTLPNETERGPVWEWGAKNWGQTP